MAGGAPLTQHPTLAGLCGHAGTLPATWASQSPALQFIYLWNNSLAGTLPPQWAGFTSLEDLSLAHNYLTGARSPCLESRQTMGRRWQASKPVGSFPGALG